MFIGGGGGDGIGPGTVVVTPDPGLMEADPGVMATAAGTFNAAAHQLHSVATATSNASGRLTAAWKGKGAEGFKGASSDTNWYSSSAADGLIGASIALTSLSRSIAAAQVLAREAIRLAGQTSDSSAALDKAYATSQAHAVSKLPASATPDQVAQAMAPTASQSAQAEALASDAARAITLMNEANTAAQIAWRAATAAFDAVTSQSPSVQLKAIDVRVKDFSKQINSAGAVALLIVAAGMAAGEIPGGDGEDDEEFTPEFIQGEEAANPALAADLAGEENMNVDGTQMDPAVAADIQAIVPVGYTDVVTVLTSFENASLDPATADMLVGADPLGGLTPADYQARYWDPTATTSYGKGSWIYPPDNGADLSSPVVPKTFAPGDTFDRFGPETGGFASPEGTPWAERALPPTSLVGAGGASTYHVYEVTDKWAVDPPPVVVTQAKVAPAFGQPGGGLQYSFDAAPGSGVNMNIQWLLRNGYLTEVTP
ncbi:MAG TPA: TNT domain-containing protein [Streptosporangiaceae bacterium]|nr:TNT domain-containing protein [Streptosporangiaceae bacterium]